MTKHITLNLRPAGNSRPETVDLDALTPRARAFAEAIHDCFDHQPLDIEFEGPESQRRSTRNWSPLKSTSPMTAVEWLEREIRTIPLDWYPIGPRGGSRVPSWEAGAVDKAITRDTVLEYMRSQHHPMDITAWDTLRGTGHLPGPDRYVCGQPQWRPETIDAYIRRDVELWPVSRIAEYLGYSGPSATGSARKQLSRWGFTAASRAPGRGGESLYASDQIIVAHGARPGRGARTDLTA